MIPKPIDPEHAAEALIVMKDFQRATHRIHEQLNAVGDLPFEEQIPKALAVVASLEPLAVRAKELLAKIEGGAS